MLGRVPVTVGLLWLTLLTSAPVAAAPLRVGIEPNTSPLSTNSPTEPPAGFAVDIVRAVAAAQGLDLEFVVKPWFELNSAFREGRIDVLAACGKNPAREAYMIFSAPHLNLHTGVFTNVRNRPPSSVAEIGTRTVGTVRDSLSYAFADRQGWSHQQLYPSLTEALTALDRGECDVVLAARIVSNHYIRLLKLRHVVLTELEVPGLDFELHLGVHPAETELLYQLNKGLARIHADGTYDQIYERWIGPLEPRRLHLRDVQPYLLALAALALLIASAFLWQRRLLQRLARQAEELSRSQEQLTLVLEGSNDGFWDRDLVTGRVHRSARWASILGYSPDELDHSSELPLKLLHPDDLPAYEAYRNQLESGATGRFQTEYRLRAKNGEWRWVLNRGKVVARDHAGRPLRMAGTLTDIAARKQTDDALAESQRLLHRSAHLLEQTQAVARVGGWEVDLRTDRVYWTAETHRIHETSPTDFQPTVENAIHFYTPESRPIISAAVEQAIRHGTPYDLELITARHRRLHVHTTGRVERIDGRTVKIYGSFRNITDERAADEEREKLRLKMLEAQKLESLGVLAGGIAHDFNNLLTVILANASFARETSHGADDERLAHIESAARRAADLCRQMLAYSGRGHFIIEPLDSAHLVEDTARLLQISIGKKARLTLSLTPDLPLVEADASQLRQIVMNLVLNAAEAIGDAPGEIHLTTRLARPAALSGGAVHSFDLPPGDCVCLEVTDTGHGMSPATIARIFDPFFTTKFTGRGLGLAAVLGIVRAHRGALTVDSEPGQGSTFRLFLPAAIGAPRLAAPSPPPALPPRSAGGTILIAEDESVVLTIADAVLRRHGYTTVLAADGHEAVKSFRAQPQGFAAVLLDLTMPGLNGAEVLRELRAINPRVRVLIMSGYSEHDISTRLRGQGEVPIIHKPFTQETLLARLAAVIG